jgi:hypothetical protein
MPTKRTRRGISLAVLTIAMMPTCGCGEPEKKPSHSADSSVSKPRGLAVPAADPPPAKKSDDAPRTGQDTTPKTSGKTGQPVDTAAIPEVFLTQQHQQQCKVNVGDALPPIHLTRPDGSAVDDFRTLLGERGTVLIWFNQAPAADDQMADLLDGSVPYFTGEGVRVIAVGVGVPIEIARAAASKAERHPQAGAVTVLRDPDGSAFATFVSGPTPSMPRTYVFDASMHVVWFDVEYSRTMRSKLETTLSVLTSR